nr:GntR family transcriptional regulator [Clostridium bornimense]
MNIYNIYKGEKAVDIIISNSSGKPIYDQIYTEIKSKIISGELKEGDPLPSMRLLAKELRISVITTKRAYEELERDGFITSITGKGSFVSGKNTEFIREDNLRKIEEHMQSIIELSKGCNLSLQDLIEMISIIYEED